MKSFAYLPCLVVLAGIATDPAEAAPQTVLIAEKDTYLGGWGSIVMNDQHGLDRYHYVGTQRFGSPQGPDGFRTLVQFDLSGLTSAPTSAFLEMTVAGFVTGSATSVFELEINAVTQPWVEGIGARPCDALLPVTCQDIDVAPGVDWSSQPTFDPTPRAALSLPRSSTSAGDTVQWDITSLVQDWYSGALPNHGLVIRDVVGGEWRSMGFGTLENDLYPNPVDFPFPDFRSHTGPRLLLSGAQATQVAIDIKPGSFPNSINLGSKGVTPVAILSTTSFDATQVDPLTVTLAEAAVRVKGNGTPQATIKDADGDGLLDLVVHVETEGLQLTSTDVQAALDGAMFDSTPVQGTDSVRVVP